MRKLLVTGLFLSCNSVFAMSPELQAAIENVRTACGGISESMNDMKTMAGVNTAVTAVGTAAGGVALGTGIAKAQTDSEIEEIKRQIDEITEKMKADAEKLSKVAVSGVIDDETINTDLASLNKDFVDGLSKSLNARIDELTKKSKTLGNVRTGTLAAATATNIAGAAIAGTNMVDKDLETRVSECIASVKDLGAVKMQARLDGSADESQMTQADKIAIACDKWSTVDLSPINKRATGAAVSSGIGAGVGLAGTITSGLANSNQVRSAEGDDARTKEKNLNMASNVLAGTTAAASLTATIFNATQISAIKRAATVADECEGALK